MAESKSIGRDRFFEVAAEQSTFRLVDDDEKPGRSTKELLWEEFHDWAKSKETQSFLSIYIARKAAYRILENQHLDSHAKLTYYKAHRDLCEYLEEEIRSWAADTPPSGPA